MDGQAAEAGEIIIMGIYVDLIKAKYAIRIRIPVFLKLAAFMWSLM